MTSTFEKILPGELYRYHGEIYEIIEVRGDRVQLRSTTSNKNIHFQRLDKLLKDQERGIFSKQREAPLSGTSHRILEGLTEGQRCKLERRLLYVRAVLENFHGHLPPLKTLELIRQIADANHDKKPPSYNTVYKWLRKHTLSNSNPLALVGGRARFRRYRLHNQPEEIQGLIQYNIDLLYFRREKCSKSDVIDAIQLSIEDLNEKRPINQRVKVPSASTLWRIIQELDTYEVENHQLGHATAIKNQHWSEKTTHRYRLLERVEADTNEIHVIVVDSYGEPIGRPYLTAIIDVASRYIIGYDISFNFPSVEKTTRALKFSILSSRLRNGQAETYIMDNGSEFAAKRMEYVMDIIGSSIVWCSPGEPNQKPFIERWFETFNEAVAHKMQGTTFSNTQQRGDYRSDKKAIYTLDELITKFEKWLDIYHTKFHSSIRMSPDEYWRSHEIDQLPPKKYSEADIHRLFLSRTISRVHSGRVRHNHLYWTGPSIPYLSTLAGKESELILYYDHSELGHAWVSHPDHPDDIHQVEAVDPEYQVGLTMDMHNFLKKKLRDQEKNFDSRTAKRKMTELLYELALTKGKRSRRLTAILQRSISKKDAVHQANNHYSVKNPDRKLPETLRVPRTAHLLCSTTSWRLMMNNSQTAEDNTAARLRLVKKFEKHIVFYESFRWAYSLLENSVECTKLREKPSSALLIGPSGSGKSTLCEYFKSSYTKQCKIIKPEGIYRTIPVFLCTLPAQLTLKSFAKTILTELGCPAKEQRGDSVDLTNQVILLFKTCHIEVAIFDEFQRITRPEAEKSINVVIDWLNHLLNETGIPIIIVGTDECKEIIYKKAILARRFPYLAQLYHLSYSESSSSEYLVFLGRLDSKLYELGNLESGPHLTDPILAAALYISTKGNLEHLRILISNAFRSSILQDRRNLKISDFFSSYASMYIPESLIKGKNPFELTLAECRKIIESNLA